MRLASLDGAIAPAEETFVPVTDEGLLRGDGAFEVARLYGGHPFALEAHYTRLERTCAGLRLPLDLAALRAEVSALLARARPVDGSLRLVLTRGGRRLAMVEPLPPRQETTRIATITYAPNRVLDGLKTLSYAGNMLAVRLAREQGFDDALLVTPHGRVLEGTTWTLFWGQAGRLHTPPLSERILASITRALVLEECEVLERPCTLDELLGADEAFVASTIREVLPIAALDAVALPAAPGPLTRDAAARYAARVGREVEAERAPA